ncbi:DUF2970 domain-containing protein [Vreelandella massiliensis]|uniref:DUF2970 domain-containing protein n=1 Tax=Vreelandella massiliensis TaxID=1816686 RepID=UPI00096AAA5D|nr:DUF2970 domain-containing protein [Halomonas massiliensis]MYL24152.1 DUF2970 domain-containing protein [Halomonas alkaliantarctica]
MWRVVRSVLAALVGVQKNQHREEDFNSDKPMAFIVTGVVITILFVLLLVAVARLAAKG